MMTLFTFHDLLMINSNLYHSPLSGGNLTYEIPKGIADDCFTVDSLRGIVTTKGTFDRETKDMYTVPIYVMESMTTQFKSTANTKTNKLYKSQFDVATIVIRITDVNDHAPEFRPGSCYPLAIPENSDLSIIHQVVATDLDEGPNGDITYSITGKAFHFSFFRLLLFSTTIACRRFFLILIFSRPLLPLLPLTFFRINGFSQYIQFTYSQHNPTSRSDNFSSLTWHNILRNCFSFSPLLDFFIHRMPMKPASRISSSSSIWSWWKNLFSLSFHCLKLTSHLPTKKQKEVFTRLSTIVCLKSRC